MKKKFITTLEAAHLSSSEVMSTAVEKRSPDDHGRTGAQPEEK